LGTLSYDNTLIADSLLFPQNKFSELFSGAYAKVKSTIYREVNPLASNLVWQPDFLLDLLENPKYVRSNDADLSLHLFVFIIF
jgi:hypothetical protein